MRRPAGLNRRLGRPEPEIETSPAPPLELHCTLNGVGVAVTEELRVAPGLHPLAEGHTERMPI